MSGQPKQNKKNITKEYYRREKEKKIKEERERERERERGKKKGLEKYKKNQEKSSCEKITNNE